MRHGRRHLNLTFKRSIYVNNKVPSFVIHSDNKDEKVTAVEVYEKGFKQMSTEMAVCKPAAENSVRFSEVRNNFLSNF